MGGLEKCFVVELENFLVWILGLIFCGFGVGGPLKNDYNRTRKFSSRVKTPCLAVYMSSVIFLLSFWNCEIGANLSDLSGQNLTSLSRCLHSALHLDFKAFAQGKRTKKGLGASGSYVLTIIGGF